MKKRHAKRKRQTTTISKNSGLVDAFANNILAISYPTLTGKDRFAAMRVGGVFYANQHLPWDEIEPHLMRKLAHVAYVRVKDGVLSELLMQEFRARSDWDDNLISSLADYEESRKDWDIYIKEKIYGEAYGAHDKDPF